MSDRRFTRLVPALFLLALASAPFAAGQAPPPPAALTLRRALEMALTRAPEVAVARADADIASASERIAWSRWGPEAYASTNPGYTTGLPVMVAGQVPSLFAFSVRQSIYDPALRAGSLGARAEAEERRSALERVSAETARAAALAFGRVAADGALVASARRSLEAQEAIARRVSSLAGEGRVTAVEADAAALDVARAKEKLLDRTFSRDLDELELKRLLDWPAGQSLAIAEEPAAGLPAPPPSGNLEAARAGDPEIRALGREIDALSLAAQARSRLFQPSVLAEAQYLRLASYNHFDDYFRRFKENDFSIAVSITVPVWAGGRTREMAAEARARVARTEAALRVRTRDLELSVRRAEADLARADAAGGVARSAEALARERARIAGALAAEGRGEPNGAELADIALARTQEELANAAQGILAARVALLALRGELTRGVAAPVPAR
jgi:outer membrane protein TolC